MADPPHAESHGEHDALLLEDARGPVRAEELAGLGLTGRQCEVLAAVTAVVAAVVLRHVRLPTESEGAPEMEPSGAAVAATELE